MYIKQHLTTICHNFGFHTNSVIASKSIALNINDPQLSYIMSQLSQIKAVTKYCRYPANIKRKLWLIRTLLIISLSYIEVRSQRNKSYYISKNISMYNKNSPYINHFFLWSWVDRSHYLVFSVCLEWKSQFSRIKC